MSRYRKERDAKCRRAAIRKNRWMNEHLDDVVEVLKLYLVLYSYKHIWI